jgi:hypothetical protein
VQVRILDPELGTQATTRVLIRFSDTSQTPPLTWSTVGADSNVISASISAICDGFEYALVENARVCRIRPSSSRRDRARGGVSDVEAAKLIKATVTAEAASSKAMTRPPGAAAAAARRAGQSVRA